MQYAAIASKRLAYLFLAIFKNRSQNATTGNKKTYSSLGSGAAADLQSGINIAKLRDSFML